MPKKGYKSVTINTQKYEKLEGIAKQEHMTVSEATIFLIDQFYEHIKNCPVYRTKPEGSN